MAHLNEGPKRSIEHATVIYTPNPARFVRQHRFDGFPFIIAKFVAHDSRLPFRSLNHVRGGPINQQWPVAEPLMLLIYFRLRHNGHGQTCHWFGPVANGPRRSFCLEQTSCEQFDIADQSPMVSVIGRGGYCYECRQKTLTGWGKKGCSDDAR
jgi:hypothetical protein